MLPITMWLAYFRSARRFPCRSKLCSATPAATKFGPDAGIGTLTIIDGKLSLQLGSDDGMAFLPESPTVFFFPSDRREQLRFDASSDGQIELAYLVNGTQTFGGPRMNP